MKKLEKKKVVFRRRTWQIDPVARVKFQRRYVYVRV